MSFRVNVDYPTRRATIHTVNGDGRCQPRRKRPQDGGWLGPFATSEAAIQAANETGLRIHPCRLCNPRLPALQHPDFPGWESRHYRGTVGSPGSSRAEETEDSYRTPIQQERVLTEAAMELTQVWAGVEEMLVEAQASGFSDEVVREMRRYATDERIHALGSFSLMQSADVDSDIYKPVYDIFREMTEIQVEVFDTLLRACDSRDPGDLESAIFSARYCQSLGEQALRTIPDLAKRRRQEEGGEDGEQGCIWGCVGAVVLVVLIVAVASICG